MSRSRIFALAILLATTFGISRPADAGGYYGDGYYGDGYYGGGYYGGGGYYDEQRYRGYYGPYDGYREGYYTPLPFFPFVDVYTHRCQHRVPVQGYNGEVRGGWVSGC
jgi:hypothetical protein